MYCQKHQCPCCTKCWRESHNACRDIVELDDVIQNAKTSNALCDIEEALAEVAENMQNIRQHQQDTLSTLKEKRKEIESEIKMIRIKINNHLDNLQEDFMKQLYAVEDKENSKYYQLEREEKEVEECQRNIINIKQHATDLQMFLSMKQIEEEVSSKDKFLRSLCQDGDLKQHSIVYEINETIQNIMSDINSFGEVNIEAKPCNIVLSTKKTKQAQIMVPIVQSRSVENILLKIDKTISTQGDFTPGCCFLPDGRLVFTYSKEGTIKVFNLEGSKDFEMEIPCGAFDIEYISDNKILAVTSGESDKQCITIVDLERKAIKKKISLSSDNYGIVLKDNALIYSAYKKVYERSILLCLRNYNQSLR
ncbi:unnamed protein product [Mytilus edulis]|uniref:B box-type domain-containing protein n=1 Tax=Mytilus edulis TaxID=6550 RepID=A0A8S3VEN0_MYTED|nr:unnamed protein product [Mytilus edulis]